MILLKDKYPEIYKTLDFTKNSIEFPLINLERLQPNANKHLYWICSDCNNSYKNYPQNEIKRSTGCVYCTGKKVLTGFNDFKTKNPEMAKRQTLNDKTDLSKVSYNSNFPWIEFECKSHTFKAKPRHFLTRKQCCKYCRNEVLLEGFNDIATKFPELLKYWKWTEENEESPNKTLTLSNKKLYLECPRGHREIKTSSSLKREDRLSTCVQCALLKIEEYGSIDETHPDIAKTFSFKNSVNIRHVSKYCSTKIKWICEKNHEWEEIGSKRIKKGLSACPYCYPSLNELEKECLNFIKEILLELEIETLIKIHERSLVQKTEIDFYLENLSKAVEFNGCFWHTDQMCMKNRGMTAKEYHNKKILDYENINIDLIYIWECDLRDSKTSLKASIIKWIQSNSKDDILIKLEENHLSK